MKIVWYEILWAPEVVMVHGNKKWRRKREWLLIVHKSRQSQIYLRKERIPIVRGQNC